MSIKLTLTSILLFLSIGAFAQSLTSEEKLVFDDVAYIISPNTGKKTILRWAGPIKYQIKGNAPEYLIKEIDTTFSQLRLLTSLDIKKTTNDEEANLIINIGEVDKDKNITTPTGKTMYYTGNFNHKSNDKSEITQVENLFIITPNQTKTDVKYSIKRIILKSLGFFKKSEEGLYSIFYSRNNNTIKIDRFDGHIISTFYNPKIKPGMTKEEVDRILYSN